MAGYAMNNMYTFITSTERDLSTVASTAGVEDIPVLYISNTKQTH